MRILSRVSLLLLLVSPALARAQEAGRRPDVDRPGTIPEFEARRARGIGRFITAAELRQLDERPFTGVLRTRLSSLAQQNGAGGVNLYNRSQMPPKALLAGGSSRCFVQIVMDGVLIYSMSGADSPPDVSEFLTRNFDGVEYYGSVSETPAEYRSPGAACGTLILWSRRS